MRKVTTLISLCAIVLAFSPAALADWDHDVKWDQLDPIVANPTQSYVGGPVSADDFQCDETGYITDIEFIGDYFHVMGEESTFLITFWSDVPASADDESHPGDALVEIDVDPADGQGIGWQEVADYDPSGNERKFKINLPVDDWFLQERGTIYWISIQGSAAGFTNMLLAEGEHWGDDAVFLNTGQPAYDHWAYDENGDDQRYTGLLPEGWTSADMSFRLTGTPVPEPATLAIVGVAGLAALLRRRKHV